MARTTSINDDAAVSSTTAIHHRTLLHEVTRRPLRSFLIRTTGPSRHKPDRFRFGLSWHKFKRKVLQAAEHRIPAGSAGRSPARTPLDSAEISSRYPIGGIEALGEPV